MKKFVAFFFIALLGFGMVACGGETPECPTCQEPVCETPETPEVPASYSYGIAYGLVHGHYVGIAEVTIGKDNKIVSAKLEEVYLPYNMGQINVTESGVDVENLPADVVLVKGRNLANNYYARYFSVNGVLYEIEVIGPDTARQSFKYKTAAGVDIEEWVTNPVNAKAYVDAVLGGTAFRANADGTKSAYTAGNASVRISPFKTTSSYWPASATVPLGWHGNMKALIDAVIGTTIGLDADDLTVTPGQNILGNNRDYWTIGDLVTGATMSDFADYYVLLQAAYANALANR